MYFRGGKMDKAIIYAKSLTSLGIWCQIKRAKRYADRHGLDVIGTHADLDLRSIDTNTQPELINLQYFAARKKFNCLLVIRKTIISKDVTNLINVESYLYKLGVKIVSVSRREF